MIDWLIDWLKFYSDMLVIILLIYISYVFFYNYNSGIPNIERSRGRGTFAYASCKDLGPKLSVCFDYLFLGSSRFTPHVYIFFWLACYPLIQINVRKNTHVYMYIIFVMNPPPPRQRIYIPVQHFRHQSLWNYGNYAYFLSCDVIFLYIPISSTKMLTLAKFYP